MPNICAFWKAVGGEEAERSTWEMTKFERQGQTRETIFLSNLPPLTDKGTQFGVNGAEKSQSFKIILSF